MYFHVILPYQRMPGAFYPPSLLMGSLSSYLSQNFPSFLAPPIFLPLVTIVQTVFTSLTNKRNIYVEGHPPLPPFSMILLSWPGFSLLLMFHLLLFSPSSELFQIPLAVPFKSYKNLPRNHILELSCSHFIQFFFVMLLPTSRAWKVSCHNTESLDIPESHRWFPKIPKSRQGLPIIPLKHKGQRMVRRRTLPATCLL